MKVVTYQVIQDDHSENHGKVLFESAIRPEASHFLNEYEQVGENLSRLHRAVNFIYQPEISVDDTMKLNELVENFSFNPNINTARALARELLIHAHLVPYVPESIKARLPGYLKIIS